MTFYVTNQNFVVLCTFILGAVLGAVYDVFTIKRVFIRTHQAFLVFEDLLFCAISYVLFFALIFITNYGYVRWYEIASVLSGFFLYRMLFSHLFIKVAVFFINLIIRAVIIIFTPLRIVICGAYRCVKALMIRLYRAYDERKFIRYSKKREHHDLELSKRGFRI